MKRMIFLLSLAVLHCSFPKKDSKRLTAIPASMPAAGPRDHCRNARTDIDLTICQKIEKSVVTSVAHSRGVSEQIDVTRYLVVVETVLYQKRQYNKEGAEIVRCVGVCSGTGTGIVLAPGVVFTARHVVTPDSYSLGDHVLYVTVALKLLNSDGQSYRNSSPILMKVAKTESPDYAILMTMNEEDDMLFPTDGPKLLFATPKPGAIVWHFGKKTGPQQGKILNDVKGSCSDVIWKIPMEIVIDHGDSGSPIFVDDAIASYVIAMRSAGDTSGKPICQGSITKMLFDVGYTP